MFCTCPETKAWMAGIPSGGFLVVPRPCGGMRVQDPAATDRKPAASGGRIAWSSTRGLIMGQSLKSGAIYLFERKDSEIQSMLKIRKRCTG